MSKNLTSGGRLRTFGKRFLSVIATLALGAGLVTVGSTAATAAVPDGITVTVHHKGVELDGITVPEVRVGDALRMQLQYDSRAHGQSVEILLGAGVNFPAVFPNNEAIESILPNSNGTGYIITFKGGDYVTPQGILNLDLTLDEIENSEEGPLEWTVGGETTSVPVVFVKAGDQRENVVYGFAKAVSPGNLNSFINTGVDGTFVSLQPGIVDEVISYTLTINTNRESEHSAGFTVTDVMDVGLGLMPTSVFVEETTWDSSGYVPTTSTRTDFTATMSGNGFLGSFADPIYGPSVITLTYQAKVTDFAALQAAIQESFDALENEAGDHEAGEYGVSLGNTATFDGSSTANATVDVKGYVSGPCTSCEGVFGKSDDMTTVYAHTDSDGNLLSPIDVTYTLSANLSQWDWHSSRYELTDNVVITDTLPAQANWNLPATIGVTGSLYSNSGTAISTLTEADNCLTIAHDVNVGSYCLDGNVLKINVGKFHNRDTVAPVYTNVAISLPAKITTVNGFDEVGGTTDGVRYRVPNTASFAIGSSTVASKTSAGDIIVPNDGAENGVNDSTAFSKEAPKSITTAPNTAVAVPYTFTVDQAQAGVPIESIRIVDHVDTRVFDLADDLRNVSVTGSYTLADPQLVPQDFIVSRTGDDLEVSLTAAGKAKVQTPGGVLSVTLTLKTYVLTGKKTVDLKNSAELFGSGDDPLYWSEFTTRGTSFGAETESRKHIFDAETGGGEWTQVLVPEHSPESVYVYRLQFIGHNGFGGVSISTETDVLPEGLEFLGFLNEADVATGGNLIQDEFDPGVGNVIATFDGAAGPSGTISISQKPGSTFSAGSTVNVYFAAKVIDDNKTIVNSFGPSNTYLVPGEPSIDIEKWNDEGEAPEYDENGGLLNDGFAGDFDTAENERGKSLTADTAQVVNFTISNDGAEALEDILVTDALQTGSEGEITDLLCVFPDDSTGTSWVGPFESGTQFECTGTMAGVSLGGTHENTATVSGVGIFSGKTVNDEDTWNAHVKSFAVGDYVWIDSNRDGVQDENEAPLEGVTVELLDDEGVVIATTTTDDRGRYYFDNLPAGTYQVQFTLTEEQGKRYRYTSYLSGEDAAVDSNSEVDPDNRLIGVSAPFVLDESNTALTADDSYEFFDIEATEGIDPTWDAGVTEILYAIGDYVWIDEDRDGVQDSNEKPLAGVKVELLDEDGEVVGTTTTDAKGRYIFDSLFAGTYQVRFTLTPEQAKWYQFTKTGSGDAANDSDAHGKTGSHIGTSKPFELGPENTALTHEYDREFWASEGIDPTWDAGVVVRPEHLAATGTAPQVMISLLGTGGFMLLLGGALMMLRRRMQDA